MYINLEYGNQKYSLIILLLTMFACNEVKPEFDISNRKYQSEQYHFNRKDIVTGEIKRLTAINDITFYDDGKWYQTRILLDRFRTIDRITDSGSYILEYPILILLSERNGVDRLEFSSSKKDVAFKHFNLNYWEVK